MRNIQTWGVVLGAVLGTFAIVFLTLVLISDDDDNDASAMGGMDGTVGDVHVPAVGGFYDGQEILFIHTEASAEQVVDMLTEMMGSPVILVPELAAVPEEALATVYVFTNGVTPEDAMGPFGFQPDVFDSVPGEEGYSPLRSVHLVTWVDADAAEMLTSVEDVIEAERQGKLTIEVPGVVVNMPFLTWPGGRR